MIFFSLLDLSPSFPFFLVLFPPTPLQHGADGERFFHFFTEKTRTQPHSGSEKEKLKKKKKKKKAEQR